MGRKGRKNGGQLLRDGMGRGGKGKNGGSVRREEGERMENKGKGGACPTNEKKSFPRPWVTASAASE